MIATLQKLGVAPSFKGTQLGPGRTGRIESSGDFFAYTKRLMKCGGRGDNYLDTYRT